MHYPHGGRLDSRFRRGNTYNDSVTEGLPTGYSWSYGTFVSVSVDTPFANDPNPPAVHFSHLLNYDYFKTLLPAVRCCPLCSNTKPECCVPLLANRQSQVLAAPCLC